MLCITRPSLISWGETWALKWPETAKTFIFEKPHFCNYYISKDVRAKSQSNILYGTIKITPVTKNGRAQNDHRGGKSCASSHWRHSATGAPTAAILVSFENLCPAAYFPALQKDDNHLELTLSWVSRNYWADHWSAHQTHVKRASATSQSACPFSHFSVPSPFTSCYPGIVRSG